MLSQLESTAAKVLMSFQLRLCRKQSNVVRIINDSLEPTVANHVHTHPWSSLVEGDEQLDRPNSQTTMELCHACVA